MKTVSEGARLIAAERQRQIDIEGWTPEHDATHTLGELAAAGACYALLETRWRDSSILNSGLIRFILWPFADKWFKPAQLPDDPPYTREIINALPIKNLVRGGAFLAAEIDRLIALKGNRST